MIRQFDSFENVIVPLYQLAKPAALARLRAEMDKELEKATKLSASDT